MRRLSMCNMAQIDNQSSICAMLHIDKIANDEIRTRISPLCGKLRLSVVSCVLSVAAPVLDCVRNQREIEA
jgi:hypothetical protein